MSTAHRPCFHPAVGRSAQGGYRVIAPSGKSRGEGGDRTMKLRAAGQNAPSEVAGRDLKAELEARERRHLEETGRAAVGLVEGPPAKEGDAPKPQRLADVDLSRFDDADDDGSSGGDDEGDDDGDDDDDSSSDEDEEAELMRELARIRREREEKARAEEEEKKREADAELMRGNPLLASGSSGGAAAFTVKRRWNDDVVFKNQARDEPKRKKRFINDTVRSDFHRAFISKYCQ